MLRWLKTKWFRWQTRHIFDWRPLSADDIKRTVELAKKFGWHSQ